MLKTSETRSEVTPGESALARNRLVLATGGTMLALLLAALDQTVVGTALPRIVSELKGLNYYPWVITAYLVFSTSMTPVAGKLGDLFGRKPLLLVGMTGFMAGSALCGLSQNMVELIIFRAVQGLFAGFLFGTVFSVVADLYPPERRGKIQGFFGGVWGVASILGPPSGGLLTDTLGWRWVFYINIPIGLIAVVVVALTMPLARSRASWRQIDFTGAGALIGVLAPLLVALSIARDRAWTSPQVVGLLLLAAGMLAVFLRIEARSPTPILPLQLFRNRTFAAAVAISFFTAFGMFSTIIYGPLIFQGVLGVSPTNSGALTIPMSLGQIAASVAVGNLMRHVVRYRFLGTIGIAVMIIGMLLLSQITVTSSPVEASRDVLLIGLGLGATFPLTMNSVQNALPRQFIGVASSQIQFFRAVGGTLATAVLGTLLIQRLPGNIDSAVAGLRVPSDTAKLLTRQGGANPQTLFDPANIARAKASLPPDASALFSSVLEATRIGLAHTLHDVFLVGAMIVTVGLVASVFLREVRLMSARPATTAAPAATQAPAAVPVQSTTAATAQPGTRQEEDAVAASRAATAASDEERKAQLDTAIERIGSKYLGDLVRALAAEVSTRYDAQLATKDQQISDLSDRIDALEREREELAERVRVLNGELDGRARELEEALSLHRRDLRNMTEALVELVVTLESSESKLGNLAERSTPVEDEVAERVRTTVP